MKVLIIEDEPLAAEKLARLLLQYNEDIEVLSIQASVEGSVQWLQENTAPDLILSDIHLGDGLCFDIFKTAAIKCPVIFCTAYDEYALKAFQYHSIDYLLKPVKYDMLAQSLEKLKAMQAPVQAVQKESLDDIIRLIRNRESGFKSRFMVKLGTKIRAVKTEEIAYFHSRNKLNLLVTKDGHHYPVDYSLEELIEMLDPRMFFHVNRSLVIHIDSAKEIHPYFKGRLKLILDPRLDEEVIISSQRTPLFKSWLDQ